MAGIANTESCKIVQKKKARLSGLFTKEIILAKLKYALIRDPADHRSTILYAGLKFILLCDSDRSVIKRGYAR